MLKDAECFTHIYLRTGRTDMRLGIDGLLTVIGGQMGLDPTEPGSVFLFCGRKKNRMKAPIFEGDGWLLCYKRLTGDCSYQWPRDESEAGKLTKQQFRWLMEGLSIEQKKVIKIISSTDLKKALTYSVNQEKYLRVFLESAIIPLDNNDAERSIKKFCVGKHSWHIIDSKKGAKASAILYSIAETAKANGLNPFEYFKFLMEQLKEYPRNDVPEEELKKLMPWSETLPDCCKQLKKQS